MSYIHQFKLKYISMLQYRASALAGILTQFFFGLVFIMVYLAFYESNGSKPMDLDALVSYIWLQQAFFSLTYLTHKDKEIISMIKDGNIAYELARPQNLYFKWFFKIYGEKLAYVSLRFLPIILVATNLPSPYKLILPINPIGFLISLTLASTLVVALVTLFHILFIYTIEAEGVLGIFKTMSELFTGSLVPILFLPKSLQIVSNILPFQYVSDIPYRIYTGTLPFSIKTVIIQIVWTIIIIILGYKLMSHALKKVEIQGG